jgi:hypothetical protein
MSSTTFMTHFTFGQQQQQQQQQQISTISVTFRRLPELKLVSTVQLATQIH